MGNLPQGYLSVEEGDFIWFLGISPEQILCQRGKVFCIPHEDIYDEYIFQYIISENVYNVNK